MATDPIATVAIAGISLAADEDLIVVQVEVDGYWHTIVEEPNAGPIVRIVRAADLAAAIRAREAGAIDRGAENLAAILQDRIDRALAYIPDDCPAEAILRGEDDWGEP